MEVGESRASEVGDPTAVEPEVGGVAPEVGAPTAVEPEDGDAADSSDDKQATRKKRNRESAALSRDRKKRQVEELEAQVNALQVMKRQLTEESLALRTQVATLKGVPVESRRSPRLTCLEAPAVSVAVEGGGAGLQTAVETSSTAEVARGLASRQPLDPAAEPSRTLVTTKALTAPVAAPVADAAFLLPPAKAPTRRGKGRVTFDGQPAPTTKPAPLTPPRSPGLTIDAGPISTWLRTSPVIKGVAPSPRAVAHADVLVSLMRRN